jgi:dolichol-phosphate mannosyltransferase
MLALDKKPLDSHQFQRVGRSGLADVMQSLERDRESRWNRRVHATQLKLAWRAPFIKHYLHVTPGQQILEVAGGGGALTGRLSSILRGENPITSVVFSPELLHAAQAKQIPNVTFAHGDEFLRKPPQSRFDFIIGVGALWHAGFSSLMDVIHHALKPGGQILFFEPSLRFPARYCNEMALRRSDTRFRATSDQIAEELTRLGWSDIHIAPHDIVSSKLGFAAMKYLQSKLVLLEYTPALRSACATMCVSARKPGTPVAVVPMLTEHASLRNSVSVVVPAYNEASNIEPLIRSLLALYGDYIREIIIVNDNSTDQTADVVAAMRRTDSRVRLINRSGPNGVGRALREGYRAAVGQYILSMDCDFIEILPELRGLFDAVANGYAGAIGSRFSPDSVLINYPFIKMLLNRICHVLIKLFLVSGVRDITNNLKLYRADILRDLDLVSPHFSANLETGLKPLLAGHNITEVAISWINRRPNMGTSTFHLRKVGYDYIKVLYHCWRYHRQPGRTSEPFLSDELTRSAGGVRS